MLFNSIAYLVFLPATYAAYRLLPHRHRNLLLLIASYVFYAWWDARFLFLVILSTTVNYCCGLMIKNGALTLKERATASLWIIGSCFFLVVIEWKHLLSAREPLTDYFNWNALTSVPESWIIFLVVGVIVLAFNLIHSTFIPFTSKKNRFLSLLIGLSVNLAILGFFKYYNFFVDNAEWLLKGLSLDPSRFHLNIILPIGISFYTFKGIGYMVDVYRGDTEPERSYRNFALFIAFFPALLAGPIDRAKNLLKQINAARILTAEKTCRGLHLIFYGFFKKVVIADGVVRTVNSVFNSTGQMSWIDVVVATFLFTVQIYCDFSGYTDIARGTAKLFGIDLMINFNLPYFSKNPREFWSRWHISLSTWLRDYLYIPLGGNKHGKIGTYRNLMFTMILGGLWHGAAWNFILWGLYHGIALSIHRAWGAAKAVVEIPAGILNGVLNTVFFFVVTCYGWLIFRAPSFEKVATLSSTLIFDFGNFAFGAMPPRFAALLGLPALLCVEIIEYRTGGRNFYRSLPLPVWTAMYAFMIFSLVIGMSTESAQFVYFTF